MKEDDLLLTCQITRLPLKITELRELLSLKELYKLCETLSLTKS